MAADEFAQRGLPEELGPACTISLQSDSPQHKAYVRLLMAWDHQLPADIARHIGMDGPVSLPAIIDARRRRRNLPPLPADDAQRVRSWLVEAVGAGHQAGIQRAVIERAHEAAHQTENVDDPSLQNALDACLGGAPRPESNKEWMVLLQEQHDLARVRAALDKLVERERPYVKRGRPRLDPATSFWISEAWQAAGLTPGTRSGKEGQTRTGPFVAFLAIMEWVMTGQAPVMRAFGTKALRRVRSMKREYADGSHSARARPRSEEAGPNRDAGA